MTAQTRSAIASVSEPTLYVAFELGATDWLLAMTSALGQAPSRRSRVGVTKCSGASSIGFQGT